MISSASALAIMRIITGGLLAYHGVELFDSAIMDKYVSWPKIQALPLPGVLVYTGKIVELIGGIMLALGLKTRVAALSAMVVMLFICFYLGQGKFWYEDQHPFLLALLCAYFAIVGGGKPAMDSSPTKH